MLSHSDIWNAIDHLAERHGLSASGLAKKAGLSSTLFNPSKREGASRKRWPSTESIAAILKATDCSLEEFVALTNPNAARQIRIPLLGLVEAQKPASFDQATGKPERDVWDEMMLPAATDGDAFALEITGHSFEPVYRDGDRIVLSPAEKPRRGDHVGVQTTQGEILIRILSREGAQKVELLPFGTERAPQTLARKDIAWMYRIIWASK